MFVFGCSVAMQLVIRAKAQKRKETVYLHFVYYRMDYNGLLHLIVDKNIQIA